MRGLGINLATAGFHIGLHYRFSGPIFLYQTHDRAWLQTYLERGLSRNDPVMAWGLSHTGAVRWTDLVPHDHAGMFDVAAELGLRFGVVLSLGAAGSRTVASFARPDRDFTDYEIASIQISVQRMHDDTTPPDPLSRALADALRCVAEGDRLSVAALRLGITERAMKARLLAARTKLQAKTTAEAVQKARLYRLI